MKPEAFRLNPNAPSYTPLSKREDHLGSDEPALCATLISLSDNQCQRTAADPDGCRTTIKCSTEVSTTMDSQACHNSFSQKPGEITEEDFDLEMDMEYLQMAFSGLSHDSITDAYLANDSDLEATIDMLTQLEMYSAEPSEILPDTLDIGDVSESDPSTSSTSKQKNAGSEAVASSSTGRNSTVAS